LEVDHATILDFGVEVAATTEAGILLSKICMGGLAEIEIASQNEIGLDLIHVQTKSPVDACIGCQYAGWPISVGDFFAMCSGPIRVSRGREQILKDSGFFDATSTVGVGILETSTIPGSDVIAHMVKETQIKANQMFLCVARTASLAGLTQVVSRSVETAMHKLHEMQFPLTKIQSGYGTAPLPPIPDKDVTALGWSNDSILYGGHVQFEIECSENEIQEMIDDIPSRSSKEFGTPFLEIFQSYNYDFYQIDPHLFSPAKIAITVLPSNRKFESGTIRNDILSTSFQLS
ncbi:MAG: methenyltetrahydromethanopterin cyclohydrolase, partial [Planctomycetota bacterium]